MMYRGQEEQDYCTEDEELPFEMEPWLGESDDSNDSARPGNPLPKLLNDDYEDVDFSEIDRACQKRMRFGLLDQDRPLLTSSGERWQFQKVSWLPQCRPSTEAHKSLFSSSYLVPVTNQSAYFEPEDIVVEVLRDLDIDRGPHLPGECSTHGSEGGSRQSKKSRVSLQTDGDVYVHAKRQLWRIDS